MTSQARLSIVIRFKNEGVLTDYMNDFFMELSDNVKRRLKPIFVIQRESISKSQNSYISKIYGPYERFKALVEGIWEAIGEKVLILDADQVISESLLVELLESKADCIFIKERSHDNNVVGMLMNMNREGVEQIFMSNWDVSRFFIPRCYNLELIRKAVDGIPLPTIETINNGEDLILYYQAMDYIQTYKIAKNIILHRDPDMLTQVRKSFSYGKMTAKANTKEFTAERRKSLNMFRRNLSYIFKSKVSAKYLLSTLLLIFIKGVPFTIGFIYGRFIGIMFPYGNLKR